MGMEREMKREWPSQVVRSLSRFHAVESVRREEEDRARKMKR
jgi:hypothetical protein